MKNFFFSVSATGIWGIILFCEFQHKIPKYGVNISLGILCIYVYEACFL